MKNESLQQFLQEREAALKALDMDYARRLMPRASSDEVRMMAMHKARYEVTTMPAELRHASRNWLEARGYGRIANLPWPTNGELPK